MTSVFFFSSRRRHTRWPRDWSSDVCSSDLSHLHRLFRNVFSAAPKIVRSRVIPEPKAKKAEKSTGKLRSEERRVGKECRNRGGRTHEKKKREKEIKEEGEKRQAAQDTI